MFIINGKIDIGVLNTADNTLTDTECEFIDLEQFHEILFHVQKIQWIKMKDFYNDGADYVFMSILGVCNSVIGFLSYLLC